MSLRKRWYYSPCIRQTWRNFLFRTDHIDALAIYQDVPVNVIDSLTTDMSTLSSYRNVNLHTITSLSENVYSAVEWRRKFTVCHSRHSAQMSGQLHTVAYLAFVRRPLQPIRPIPYCNPTLFSCFFHINTTYKEIFVLADAKLPGAQRGIYEFSTTFPISHSLSFSHPILPKR